LIKPDRSPAVRTETRLSSPTPTLSYAEVRDKAAAELQQGIDRLPKAATPPSTTFFYDVSASMNRGLTPRRPWSAIIRGRESTVDPETREPNSRTDFTINAEYVDGVWTFDSYNGVVTNLQTSQSATSEHSMGDLQATAPPAVVSLFGLRIPDRPNASISITR
jgi:hypothetical protein